MLYQMKLQTGPFNKIKSGEKTLEVRLNDEKRRLLKAGDKIEFLLVSDPLQKVLVEIMELYHFSTFRDLYYAFEPTEYGSNAREAHEEMYTYYSREDEVKYGVLGIRVRVE